MKKLIFITIDFFKKVFMLENLTKDNISGQVSTLLKLRLFKKSKVNVPYSLGRSVRGVSFTGKNLLKDPFAKLCFDISKNVSDSSMCESLLSVLEKESLLTAADIVNLKSNSKLASFPAWAIIMPWENITIENFYNTYPNDLYINRNSNGLTFNSKSMESIIQTMYSHKHAKNRINQMRNLYQSIKNRGVIEDDNLPKINILIKDNQWRWFMGDGGNHRSYVMSCLSYEFFTARISQVINRKDVYKWPNVKNGTYSAQEAKKVFDMYFEGSEIMRGIV